MSIAEAILILAAAYSLIGLVFGIMFIIRGVAQVDPTARAAPWSFRALILPGVTVLWPLILIWWLRANRRVEQI